MRFPLASAHSMQQLKARVPTPATTTRTTAAHNISATGRAAAIHEPTTATTSKAAAASSLPPSAPPRPTRLKRPGAAGTNANSRIPTRTSTAPSESEELLVVGSPPIIDAVMFVQSLSPELCQAMLMCAAQNNVAPISLLQQLYACVVAPQQQQQGGGGGGGVDSLPPL